MRVVLSTYGSRGDVEPIAGLAVRLRELGARVKVCAPPDFAPRLAEIEVPMVPVGPSARALTKAKPRPSSMPERAAAVIASQMEAIIPAAEGWDALVVTGMMPAAAGALSVAEKLGIPSVSVTFQQLTLPSPARPPLAYAGRPFPPAVTDNRALWDLDAEIIDELFGAALATNRATIGLPPVDHVRDYVIGDQPWLATDPTLDPPQPMPGLDVVQTGAWFLPDTRPLPTDLLRFLDDGPPPIYLGFGSMPLHDPADAARAAIDAVRATGHRAVIGRGWADLTRIDDRTDCFLLDETNHQALFPRVAAVIHHGGAGTTATAARAGTPQVIVPQLADQPYWATRVTDLAIGTAHNTPTFTTESLTTTIDSALPLTPRAKAVADLIRTDGTTIAATHLLDLLRR